MNVSSVKNLNGEVFSAVQDASLTNVVQTNSGNWQDITAYQNASATYLTAVDLSPYQTIAGMTAYQPVGSYATTNELEQVSADITATIPSTAGLASESYVQTNSAVLTGMIDGKQDTLTFGYDEQDRINSINSSALAGGGDVPEDVMVESAIGYNAVGEISAYGNSAIAQYGAEKQWLVHDDTLVHAANSAQYALGCNISALQRLMGIDETVLFENSTGFQCTANAKLSFNENPFNFTKIKIYGGREPASRKSVQCQEFLCDSTYTLIDFNTIIEGNGNQQLLMYHSRGTLVNSGIDWNVSGTICKTLEKSVQSTTASPQSIVKVIGIGRKQ